jgi:zinc protease
MTLARTTCNALTFLGLVAAACSTSDRKPDDAPPPPSSPSAAPTQPAADFSKLPSPSSARTWVPPTVETWTMPNGVSVYFVPQTHVPLVSVSLVVPGGSSSDPPGKAGATALMADLLDEGAAGRNALQLGEAWQRLGADYTSSVSTDAVVLSVDTLADTFADTLALFADVALRPDLSSVEFERRKAQRIAGALASEADPASTRSVALRRVLFGNGYGAMPADGVRDTISKLKIDDAVAQYRGGFIPQGAAFIVVGSIERAKVETELLRYFGEWVGNLKVAFQPVDSSMAEKAVYFIDHPGASQSAIAVAQRADGASAPDLFEATVYNWAMGGAFTSRINLKLREEKGFTYGARSQFTRWAHAGFFSVGALVKAPHTRESIDEIFRDLEASRTTRPISEEEERSAREGLLLGFPSRFENMGGVAAQVAELPLYGRPVTWYQEWPKRVGAVTAEGIAKVATSVGTSAGYIIVVSGDFAAVGPSFEGIGVPVYRLDAQGNRLPAPKGKKK